MLLLISTFLFSSTINDWKDLAVVMGKVISDPTVLNRFADDVWRNFKVNTLKKLTDFLERIGLNDLITKIKSVVDKITNLDGFSVWFSSPGGSIPRPMVVQ